MREKYMVMIHKDDVMNITTCDDTQIRDKEHARGGRELPN